MDEMYELEYTGSVYTGEKKNGRLEGNGTYEFESGNKVCQRFQNQSSFHDSFFALSTRHWGRQDYMSEKNIYSNFHQIKRRLIVDVLRNVKNC